MRKHKLVFPVLLVIGLAGFTVSVAGTGEEPLSGSQPAEAEILEFTDRFTSLDRQRWSVSDGWKNGSYAANDWRASQTSLSGGLKLKFAAHKTSIAEYSGAEIQSKARFGHGYYESRFRAMRGSGLITGFFTYIGPHFGKPWHEIDIEILGAHPDRIQVTYFTDGKKVKKTLPLSFDAASGAHVYGFDWQEKYIRWYVDGVMIHEARGETVPLPSERQKIMFSVWGSDTLRDWLGPLDTASVPASALVNCVAYSANVGSGGRCR